MLLLHYLESLEYDRQKDATVVKNRRNTGINRSISSEWAVSFYIEFYGHKNSRSNVPEHIYSWYSALENFSSLQKSGTVYGENRLLGDVTKILSDWGVIIISMVIAVAVTVKWELSRLTCLSIALFILFVIDEVLKDHKEELISLDIMN